MTRFSNYIEGKHLGNWGKKVENVPKANYPKIIDGWEVWFVNSSNMDKDDFDAITRLDQQMITKLLAVLKSVGIRKHNRVPIILSYAQNTSDAGSYKSSDDYLVIYRDPQQQLSTLIGTIAHEIGHAIYNKLPEEEYEQIKANSDQIMSYTKYTSPSYAPDSEGHQTGNEWFADYVAASLMKGFGLAADTMVGSWEPQTNSKDGIDAVRKTLSGQVPGRTMNKSAAAFRQKNLWMFDAVQNLLNVLKGRGPITVASIAVPQEIKTALGPNSNVKDVLEEFLMYLGGRLESMKPADRHLFLKTLHHTLAGYPGYGDAHGSAVGVPVGE